jgi:competence protein ComEC
MNRPLVWVAIAWAAGTWAAGEAWIPGLLAPLGVFFCGLIFAILVPGKPALRPLSVTLCFFAIGALLWNARHAGPPGDEVSRFVELHPNQTMSMEGRVQRSDLYIPGIETLRFVVDVDEVTLGEGAIPLTGRVLVWWRDPGKPILVGQRVQIKGNAKHRTGRVNPGIYDAEDRLHAENTYSEVSARTRDSVKMLADGPWWSFRHQTSSFRSIESEWFRQIAPARILPFIYAVWLGDRNQLPREDSDTFRLSGTAHILAVSGVHVGIIFASTMFALRVFMRNGRYRALVAMATVATFAFVAGASVTSLRAALMVCIYLVAELFDREPDTPTALSLAAILFLGYNPDTLYHLGFQLSFVCVASILIFAPAFDKLLGPLPFGIRQTVAVSLSVQILPVPLMIYNFHAFPLCGPAINVFVVPLLSVVLWLCFLATLTAIVSLPLATVFTYAALPAVTAIHSIAGWGAAVQHIMPAVTSPSAGAVIAYVSAVLLAVGIRSVTRKQRWIHVGIVGLLLLSVPAFWRDWTPDPKVTFLDVGHGDATVIQSPGGRIAVVDAGNSNEFADYGERAVAPYLWYEGSNRIDYLFLTHADRDHMGGALYLLEHMSVGEVLLGPVPSESDTEREVLARCAEKAVPARRVVAGQTFDLGGATLTVLHPPADWPGVHDDNNLSIVLRLDWETMRVLLPGDVESVAETMLLFTDCDADVLKVPHHGSKTSSTEPFIDAVSPKFAVISTGGRYGHEAVSTQVLDRYQRRGIEIFRTDELGGIVLHIENGVPAFTGTR